MFLIFGILAGMMLSLLEYIYKMYESTNISKSNNLVTPIEREIHQNDMIQEYIDDCFYILQKKQSQHRANPEHLVKLLRQIHKLLDQ